jgi:hypothetical protein
MGHIEASNRLGGEFDFGQLGPARSHDLIERPLPRVRVGGAEHVDQVFAGHEQGSLLRRPLEGGAHTQIDRECAVKEASLKLLYCVHCGDVVRLFPEKRYCLCGRSWGNFLEDNSTTIQSYPSVSLGLANTDFQLALNAFVENPNYFSPVLAIRAWINPLSESDVTFAAGETTSEDDEGYDSETPASHEEQAEDTPGEQEARTI